MDLDSLKISQLPPHISTVIFILNALNTSLSISANEQYLTFQQLILPLFLATFSGPIAANIVTKYFTFTREAFIAFFIAVLIFSAFKRVKYMACIYKVAPMVGKVLMVCDMKNRDIPLHLMAFWILVSSFVGIIVVKTLLKKELEIAEDEFKDILGTILCLAIARYFNLNDIYSGLMVLILIVFIKKDVIIKCKRKQTLTEEPLETIDSDIKTPRRRGRPKKTESVENPGSVNQTPRRKSSRRIDFDE